MRTPVSALLATLALALTPACGSSDDDPGTPDANGGGNPDAAPNIDAPTSAIHTGIGEPCNQSMPCSQAQTDLCLSAPGAAVGFCSFECATDREVTTNQQGQILLEQIPEEDHLKCVNAYMGEAGASLCAVIFQATPPPPGGAFQPNTTYTIKAACAHLCDQQGQCPTGYSCRMGSCELN
jgi:hypothetical protein